MERISTIQATSACFLVAMLVACGGGSAVPTVPLPAPDFSWSVLIDFGELGAGQHECAVDHVDCRIE